MDPRLGLRLRAFAHGLLALDRFQLAPDQEASTRRHAENQGEHAGEDRPRRRPRAEILAPREPQLPPCAGLLYQRPGARAAGALAGQAGRRRVRPPLGRVREALQGRTDEGPELQPGQRSPQPARRIHDARGLPPGNDASHGEDPRDEPRPAGDHRWAERGQRSRGRDDRDQGGPERPRVPPCGDQPLPS